MSEDTRLFLFVYAKDGKVRVLTHDEACGNEVRMKQDGWKHTATITAREWIRHIANSPEYSGRNIDELRGIPPDPDSHLTDPMEYLAAKQKRVKDSGSWTAQDLKDFEG